MYNQFVRQNLQKVSESEHSLSIENKFEKLKINRYIEFVERIM